MFVSFLEFFLIKKIFFLFENGIV